MTFTLKQTFILSAFVPTPLADDVIANGRDALTEWDPDRWDQATALVLISLPGITAVTVPLIMQNADADASAARNVALAVLCDLPVVPWTTDLDVATLFDPHGEKIARFVQTARGPQAVTA